MAYDIPIKNVVLTDRIAVIAANSGHVGCFFFLFFFFSFFLRGNFCRPPDSQKAGSGNILEGVITFSWRG